MFRNRASPQSFYSLHCFWQIREWDWIASSTWNESLWIFTHNCITEVFFRLSPWNFVRMRSCVYYLELLESFLSNSTRKNFNNFDFVWKLIIVIRMSSSRWQIIRECDVEMTKRSSWKNPETSILGGFMTDKKGISNCRVAVKSSTSSGVKQILNEVDWPDSMKPVFGKTENGHLCEIE